MAQRVRLNKTVISKLPPGGWLIDTENSKLRVYRTPKGVASFYFSYGTGKRGKNKRTVIGRCDAITPEQAREEAQRLSGAVAAGRDPAAEKRQKRETPTVSEFNKTYLKWAEANKAPSSVVSDAAMVRNHVAPAIGSLRLDQVRKANIMKLVTSFEGRTQGNRVLSLCSKFFNLAADWGYIRREDNPCRGVKRASEKSRMRKVYLSQAQIATVGKAMAESKDNPYALAAIRLMLFTGMRHQETLSLRWENVDLDNNVLNIPKTKEQSYKTIPLHAPALAVLTSLPRVKDCPWVFPGRRPGQHYFSVRHVWERIKLAAGIPDCRPHDLRHTFASILITKGGANLSVIQHLLGHGSYKTTLRYAHLSQDALRAASEAGADAICAAMKNGDRKDNVVSIKQRR